MATEYLKMTTRSELLRNEVDRFARMIQGVERGEVRALHGTRVASRRLRELLPVLQLDRDVTRKLVRRLRRVTSRLGTVRELDVLLLLIDELHVSRRDHAQALSRVAVAVAKERDDARDRLGMRVPMADLRRLAKKLGRCVVELEKIERARTARATTRSWRWAVDARVATRAARLEAAIHSAGAVYLPERLHDVRIDVKKLRYALELRAQVVGDKKDADVKVLRRVQDALGRMHDLQVLIDRTRQVQASLAPPSVEVWRALDALVLALDADCRQLHARYMRRRDELLAITERLATRLGPAAPGSAESRPRSRAAG